MYAEAGEVAVLVAAVTVHADQNAAVDIPTFFVARLPVLVVAAFERGELAAAAGAVQVELDVAIQFQVG
ncbi:hypothetical protein D3C87_1870300 [compost metagenome]